jgi:hypothetical protein
MSLDTWLRVATVLDAMVFLPGAVMAFNAVNLALAYSESVFVGAIALLFIALPVFCVLAPMAAWRLHKKRSEDMNAAVMVAAPLVYAGFLLLFLLAN